MAPALTICNRIYISRTIIVPYRSRCKGLVRIVLQPPIHCSIASGLRDFQLELPSMPLPYMAICMQTPQHVPLGGLARRNISKNFNTLMEMVDLLECGIHWRAMRPAHLWQAPPVAHGASISSYRPSQQPRYRAWISLDRGDFVWETRLNRDVLRPFLSARGESPCSRVSWKRELLETAEFWCCK